MLTKCMIINVTYHVPILLAKVIAPLFHVTITEFSLDERIYVPDSKCHRVGIVIFATSASLGFYV